MANGAGWGISEQSGQCKLMRRYADGSRSGVTLPFAWAPSSSIEITTAVSDLRELCQERGVGLQEAFQLWNIAHGAAVDKNDAAGVTNRRGQVNWQAVVDQFLESRADRRASTLDDTKSRLKNMLLTLRSKPAPRDGRSLCRNYAKQHFKDCPAGGSGRKRHLQDISACLKFAVNRLGIDHCWLPVDAEERRELIGSSDRSTEDALTPPVKPEALEALLDALEAEGKAELRLAVALVGLYGLRPAELATLSVEDGKLYVGAVKRNARSMNKQQPPRLSIALDIPGREGEGARALQLYASGLVKLPKAIRTAIDQGNYQAVGMQLRQYLIRNKHWRALAAATPGLTPYSLRHGYAWRAHKSYDRSLSVRDCSALMGHSPQVHHQHYGRWTDEEGLLDAVNNLTSSSGTRTKTRKA